LRCLEAPLAQADDLTRVHHSAYVEQIFEHAPLEGYRQLDPDTAMNPHSRGAPHGRCGQCPCGHHATYTRSIGFPTFALLIRRGLQRESRAAVSQTRPEYKCQIWPPLSNLRVQHPRRRGRFRTGRECRRIRGYHACALRSPDGDTTSKAAPPYCHPAAVTQLRRKDRRCGPGRPLDQ
jgi:hypothetical protein